MSCMTLLWTILVTDPLHISTLKLIYHFPQIGHTLQGLDVKLPTCQDGSVTAEVVHGSMLHALCHQIGVLGGGSGGKEHQWCGQSSCRWCI